MLPEGAEAPDFSLPDQNSEARTLREFADRWVLLYFYPKDDTPGCTTEACALRDAYAEYEKRGITILGVSPDSAESHRDFALQHELPFTLLADEGKGVIRAYGAEGIMTKRMSYLIGPNGVVKKTYPNVEPAAHAEEIVADFDALNAA